MFVEKGTQRLLARRKRTRLLGASPSLTSYSQLVNSARERISASDYAGLAAAFFFRFGAFLGAGSSTGTADASGRYK